VSKLTEGARSAREEPGGPNLLLGSARLSSRELRVFRVPPPSPALSDMLTGPWRKRAGRYNAEAERVDNR
jgi:hypothetical protein